VEYRIGAWRCTGHASTHSKTPKALYSDDETGDSWTVEFDV